MSQKSELAGRIFHFNLIGIKSGLGPSISVKTRDEKAPSHPQTLVGASTTWDESGQSNQVDRVELTSGIFVGRRCRHVSSVVQVWWLWGSARREMQEVQEQFARLVGNAGSWCAVGNGREG